MKFILDYSTWRCGDESYYRLGKGSTRMRNEQGFECCLGQFSKQANPEITNEMLLGRSTPSSVGIDVAPFTMVKPNTSVVLHSTLSNEAILINDDDYTTPIEKIEKLKELFGKEGHEIEVINLPETL